MTLDAFRAHLAGRWWVVAAVAALALLGAVIASVTRADEHNRSIQLVMRPAPAVTTGDVPGTLDALESDGPLVQTVIAALGSRGLVRAASDEAGVPYSPDYQVEVTARPGSSLIETTLTVPDEEVADPLVEGYTTAAAEYVEAGYPAYVLARLGSDTRASGSDTSTAQVLILALLVGALLGLALVAAELRFKPRLQALGERVQGAGRREAPVAAAPLHPAEWDPLPDPTEHWERAPIPPELEPEPPPRAAPTPSPQRSARVEPPPAASKPASYGRRTDGRPFDGEEPSARPEPTRTAAAKAEAPAKTESTPRRAKAASRAKPGSRRKSSTRTESAPATEPVSPSAPEPKPVPEPPATSEPVASSPEAKPAPVAIEPQPAAESAPPPAPAAKPKPTTRAKSPSRSKSSGRSNSSGRAKAAARSKSPVRSKAATPAKARAKRRAPEPDEDKG